MDKPGLIFIISGVFLMGLSGLEKVLIFTSFNGDVHQMQVIIDLTPSYLWHITNFTFGFGLVSFILGIILYLYKALKQ